MNNRDARKAAEKAARLEQIHAKRRALQASMPPFTGSSSPPPKAPRGTVNAAMVCPHCQTKGTVFTYRTKVKRGISGGKATGAILTGGLSLLGTGLSRKQEATRATCSNCGAEWLF